MMLVKTFHIFFAFVWIGNLLTLTRFIGYSKSLEPAVQAKLTPLFRRLSFFVGIPAMVLTLVLGLMLLTRVNLDYRAGWLHMKLTFAIGLIAVEVLTCYFICSLDKARAVLKNARFKILHYAAALCLLGVLVSIYVVHANIILREKLQNEQKAVAETLPPTVTN